MLFLIAWSALSCFYNLQIAVIDSRFRQSGSQRIMKTVHTQKLVECLVCVMCLFSLLPARASAWGAEGHRIVAPVVAKHLDAQTRIAVDRLPLDDNEDL